MVLSNVQYSFCVDELRHYDDRASYISDVALSSVWADPEDADVPEDRIEFLGDLFDAAHRSFKEIAASLGISVRQLAFRFAIPQRTAENWSAGVNTPPLWTLLLIQEAAGIYKIPRAGEDAVEC